MNAGGGTMSKELLDYFDFDVNTPSANNYKGYRLIACDGSNLTIATNPNDAEMAYKSNQFGTITNHLHLNAFYDVLNRIYLDSVLQTASEYQEYRACIKKMEISKDRHV